MDGLRTFDEPIVTIPAEIAVKNEDLAIDTMAHPLFGKVISLCR